MEKLLDDFTRQLRKQRQHVLDDLAALESGAVRIMRRDPSGQEADRTPARIEELHARLGEIDAVLALHAFGRPI